MLPVVCVCASIVLMNDDRMGSDLYRNSGVVKFFAFEEESYQKPFLQIDISGSSKCSLSLLSVTFLFTDSVFGMFSFPLLGCDSLGSVDGWVHELGIRFRLRDEENEK